MRFEYLEPKTVEEAVSLLARYGGKAKVIAQGTDLLVKIGNRVIEPKYIVDITSIPGLDYIDLDENGAFQLTTPTHAGKVYTTVICTSDKPQMATLRPGLVEAKLLSAARKAETIKVDPQIKPDEARVKVTGFVKADPKTIDLEEAEIIVAGGGGMGAKENFRLLEELAEVLGGSVAGSRVPVDEGWITIERQVGQTGKTVASQLYIACGISGSIYHAMGMKDCKVIIAINKDRAAPIFKLADVGVVGDVLEVVPALTLKLRETLKSTEGEGAAGS